MRTIILLLLLTASAAAQQPARGTFSYIVDGIYQGEAMAPWSATTQVGDSAGSYFVKHVVHRAPGARFEYTFVPGQVARWINESRGGSHSCEVSVTGEVPDFALPFALAARDLTAAHDVQLTMLKCAASIVQTIAVRGTVVADSSGWTIHGDADYPFTVLLSADHRVLKFVQPQGVVGIATYTLQ